MVGKPIEVTRRTLMAGLGAVPVLAALARPGWAQGAGPEWTPQQAQAALKNATGTKLVLLGTGGGPVPGRARRMTSHVMVSNGGAYVLDCGLGVTDQFARTGLSFAAIRSIFLTHHHPDHNVEYGPLLVIGWVQGMRDDVKVFGPPPLKDMTETYLRAWKQTIGFWSEDYKMKPLQAVDVTEISGAGVVMRDDTVTVTSAVVEHPPVTPALAYRFDFKDRSIAFSGDTAPTETVSTLARGADVLVHEVMFVPAVETYVKAMIAKGRPVKFDDFMRHMKADHSPTDDVGRIAQSAGVKTLVLSHLTPAIDSVTDEMWRAAVAPTFKGEIIVGRDLMVI